MNKPTLKTSKFCCNCDIIFGYWFSRVSCYCNNFLFQLLSVISTGTPVLGGYHLAAGICRKYVDLYGGFTSKMFWDKKYKYQSPGIKTISAGAK